MNKWFWNLSSLWQNIIGFGLATIVGVGMAWLIVKVIPIEYKDAASCILLIGAVGCMLRVVIGMYLDSKKEKKIKEV